MNLHATNWLILGEAGLPLLLLIGGGLLFILLSSVSKFPSRLFPVVALSLVLISFCLAWHQWWDGIQVVSAMLIFDRLASALDLIFLLSLFLTLFFSRDIQGGGGEYYALLFFATAGLMFISHGEDLIVIFLGLEIASLASVILAGFKRGFIKSGEAALKYFILGSFASGFLLYGIALLYGATNSTSLTAWSATSGSLGKESLLFSLGIALLLLGVFFKIAAVPFHFWSPDVYEGAPTPVTAFLATGVKAGGFALLLRLVAVLSPLEIPWVPLFWVLSVLTMSVGNLMALRQSNIKRMLAYSSIAHAGYGLVGVTAALQDSTLESNLGAVVFYLFAYAVMTLGAFGTVIALGRRSSRIDDPEELSDYAELAQRHPVLAATLTVFMLSLIGVPPTVGFVGKFYLFSGAVQAGLYGLVVIAVLNSVVSVYYYLGPIVKMYFQKGRGYDLQPLSRFLVAGLFLCLFGVLYFGVFPSDFLLIARESIRELSF